MGRMSEAREAARESLDKIEKHLQLHPDDVRAVSLGSGALYTLGDHARSLEWTDLALSMDPEQVPILYNAACSYAMLGHESKSLDCLERALRQGFSHLEWMTRDPELSSVRDHPRFKRLIECLESGRMSCAAQVVTQTEEHTL